jgi:putative ABC transport system permease protein
MASTDQFDTIADQFSKLSKITKVVIIAAIILSVALILLVILLFMRDRKRELGIYLALGERKINIILQIMVEVLSVAVVALLLSLVTGKFLGSFASDAFLSSNSSSSTGNAMVYDLMTTSAMFNTGTQVTAESLAADYSVTFTLFYIVTYLLAGLGTVIVSVLLSTLYIFRLKPRKILLG